MELDDKRLGELEKKVLAYRFRIKDADERKTYDEVFDQDTLLTLYDLMSGDVLDTLDFPIATGKEGNVFRATTASGDYLAVKIYRVSNATFNNIQKYIVGDERFRNVGRNRRRGIFLWAQKEFRNLERLSSAGVLVPEPVTCQKNVIAMEYVNVDGDPAPTLKQAGTDDPQALFDTLSDQLDRMYKKAGLIHADFSEYNVLMRGYEPTIIDVGQAVLLNHPMAPEFLERDVRNLARYFKGYGIKADPKALLSGITGER
jgi:RIO kinase 1